MDNFCIVVNRLKDVDLKVTDYITRYLESKGKSCVVAKELPEDQDSIRKHRSVIPEPCECVIVLGGDGTVLQAAGSVGERNIPLIGVNLGTVGYLAEVERAGIDAALERLISGDYEIEERMMLEGRFGDKKDCALNDIVITRNNTAAINYNIYVNDLFLYSYHADGIILSTPTGSTGYNMSAGGPIVEPSGSMILITPVCPHTLNSRSLVLSPQSKITVEIAKGRDNMPQTALASFDGNIMPVMNSGDKIYIERSNMTTRIIRLNRVSFLENIGKKLE
ncbi:MAG: NAD(+)/NADH kinase [Butyrivibrio sp.]|nr:NAD(+)/NADH kinase [Butyrivibrio sp.]